MILSDRKNGEWHASKETFNIPFIVADPVILLE
jgi:hypothetical protein